MSKVVSPDARRRAVSLQDAPIPEPWSRPFRWLRPGLERATGLRDAAELYARVPDGLTNEAFFDWTLRDLDVRFVVDPEELKRIPTEGPLLVIANHPFGGIDGMALPSILRQVRPDVRLLGNRMLGRLPEVEDLFVYVDPYDNGSAAKRNLKPLRQSIAHLRAGGALATFPAGEVASWSFDRRAIVDNRWSHSVALLARETDGPVVPIWFGGHNGWSFQLAGMVHPALRTAILARQLFTHRGQKIPVRIGKPIPPRTLRTLDGTPAIVEYLRHRVEILAERPDRLPPAIQPRSVPVDVDPLIEAVPADEMAAEIAALPEETCLVRAAELSVFMTEAPAIPRILREIGRLRELTFRKAGEGTGREIDTDRFDRTYEHLFIWNTEKHEVVGAYRIGRTDRLLAAEGRRGLYTSTLFRMQKELFERMGPALEMGRSFIRPEYQKSFTPLLLMWRAIGSFCARDNGYTTLFGPVSISADYTAASQRLMISFLQKNDCEHEWAQFVRPRTPFRPQQALTRRLKPLQLRDLSDVSTFIGEIENDGKGVPILLRQYLKLGGRLLGFNVDPDFADVLDVMVLVDLRTTPDRVLKRYMTREELARFRART